MGMAWRHGYPLLPRHYSGLPSPTYSLPHSPPPSPPTPPTHTCTDNPSPALQPLPPGHAGPGYSCAQDLSRPNDGEGERRILPQVALHCIRDPAVPQNGGRNQWVSQNVLKLTLTLTLTSGCLTSKCTETYSCMHCALTTLQALANYA